VGLPEPGLGAGRLPLVAQEPSQRLEKLRAEIEAREARARELSRTADGMLAQLEALDVEIVEVRRSQKKLSERERQAMNELDAARSAISESNQQMERIERDLGPRLVALYKFTATGGLPALYSQRDFQSLLRLRDGLSKVLSADARLLGRYRAARLDWQRRSDQAQSLVAEIAMTRQDGREKRRIDRDLRVQRRNLVALYRQRALREEQAAEELRQAASRLETEVIRLPRMRGASPQEGLVKGALLLPVQGKIRTGFGIQFDPEFQTRIRSGGIEISAARGSDVRAVAPGRVLYADWFKGYGQMVIVDHGEEDLTVFGYLDEVVVGVDDTVERGQVIGKVGDTGSLSGPGLYFELRRSGKPEDPRPWFESGSGLEGAL
jgi:murein hydrolase activator